LPCKAGSGHSLGLRFWCYGSVDAHLRHGDYRGACDGREVAGKKGNKGHGKKKT
jgi:hypothetical protein